MTRFIVAAILVITLMGAFHVNHASAHTGTYRVNAGNGLNLRTGPGGQYRKIETMAHGTLVKARGHRGNWMKLTSLTSGNTGWAWLDYLEPVSGSGGGQSAGGSGAICLTNYWGEAICSSANVGNAIRYWAGQYGIGWWWLAATAACESNFRIDAYNPSSGVTGLFQFQPGTFWAWGGVDLYDPWDQSRVAAKMFANGAANQYHCAQLIGYA